MKTFIKISFSIVVVFLIMSSCASSKDIQYFQNIEYGVAENTTIAFAAQIQSGDLLFINVSATNPEAALPFNLYETPIIDNSFGNTEPITYLVDDEGYINFPVLGRLRVSGLTTRKLTEKLELNLLEYIKKPIINIRFANFRISVLGEVASPGTFSVFNERISIIEAIALAGDLTIYGQRKNILLTRIENNEKLFVTLDLTNKDIFNSPYYNLKQNDILYIPPNKTKVNASAVGPNTGVIISSASLLITVLALILR